MLITSQQPLPQLAVPEAGQILLQELPVDKCRQMWVKMKACSAPPKKNSKKKKGEEEKKEDDEYFRQACAASKGKQAYIEATPPANGKKRNAQARVAEKERVATMRRGLQQAVADELKEEFDAAGVAFAPPDNRKFKDWEFEMRGKLFEHRELLTEGLDAFFKETLGGLPLLVR